MELGTKIKKLRQDQGRSLTDVAAACGFSKSLLSKIENGRTVPPIATLLKIAEALGTTVSTLLDDSRRVGTVYTPRPDTDKRIMTERGYAFYAFAVERGDKLFQPFLFTARKGEAKKTKLAHAGEEFIYVLEGSMKYRVGQVEYTLQPGDSLYFDSVEDHALTPLTDEVKYIAVFGAPGKS